MWCSVFYVSVLFEFVLTEGMVEYFDFSSWYCCVSLNVNIVDVVFYGCGREVFVVGEFILYSCFCVC